MITSGKNIKFLIHHTINWNKRDSWAVGSHSACFINCCWQLIAEKITVTLYSQTWEKTQTCRSQILEVHKLPQKVRDHDMYILPKFEKKIQKWHKCTKNGKTNPKLVQNFWTLWKITEIYEKFQNCRNSLKICLTIAPLL